MWVLGSEVVLGGTELLGLWTHTKPWQKFCDSPKRVDLPQPWGFLCYAECSKCLLKISSYFLVSHLASPTRLAALHAETHCFQERVCLLNFLIIFCKISRSWRKCMCPYLLRCCYFGNFSIQVNHLWTSEAQKTGFASSLFMSKKIPPLPTALRNGIRPRSSSSTETKVISKFWFLCLMLQTCKPADVTEWRWSKVEEQYNSLHRAELPCQ